MTTNSFAELLCIEPSDLRKFTRSRDENDCIIFVLSPKCSFCIKETKVVNTFCLNQYLYESNHPEQGHPKIMWVDGSNKLQIDALHDFGIEIEFFPTVVVYIKIKKAFSVIPEEISDQVSNQNYSFTPIFDYWDKI